MTSLDDVICVNFCVNGLQYWYFLDVIWIDISVLILLNNVDEVQNVFVVKAIKYSRGDSDKLLQ